MRGPRGGKRSDMGRASRDRLRAVTPWGAPADASGMESRQTHWEIAQQGFGDGWYLIGTSEGPDAETALQAWTERKRPHLSPGTYGVRAAGESAWEPFRVDAYGVPSRSGVVQLDECRATEPERAARSADLH